MSASSHVGVPVRHHAVGSREALAGSLAFFGFVVVLLMVLCWAVRFTSCQPHVTHLHRMCFKHCWLNLGVILGVAGWWSSDVSKRGLASSAFLTVFYLLLSFHAMMKSIARDYVPMPLQSNSQRTQSCEHTVGKACC
jgi:hypothetical protein